MKSALITGISGHELLIKYQGKNVAEASSDIADNLYEAIMNYVWWKVETTVGNPQLAMYYERMWMEGKKEIIREKYDSVSDGSTKLVVPAI